MIALVDAVRLMNRAVKRCQDTMLEEGSLFPSIILYRKGTPIIVEQDYRGVILVKNTTLGELMSPDFQTEDGEWIYTSHVLFKYGDGIDERDINRAAKNLTKEHQPHMLGLVMSCLYTNDGGGQPIQQNPDTVRLLHSVFYFPQEREGKVIFIPFINRGELPYAKRHASDSFDDEVNYDITFFESGWTSSAGSHVKPSIANPYRCVRR